MEPACFLTVQVPFDPEKRKEEHYDAENFQLHIAGDRDPVKFFRCNIHKESINAVGRFAHKFVDHEGK